jgi:hypothetical protein
MSLAEARKCLNRDDLTDKQLIDLLNLMEEIAFMVLNDKGNQNDDNDCGRLPKVSAKVEPPVRCGNNKNPG